MAFQLYLENNNQIFLNRNMAIISKLYKDIISIYGPYNNSKDGRSRVVLYDGKRRITRQFSKLKMEVKLNRRLGIDETVDHKDDNFMNDDYSNLELLDRKTHCKQDVYHLVLKTVNCEWCNKSFQVSKDQAYQNLNKAGPFCSKSCIGKYGTSLQHYGEKPRDRNFVKEYYKPKHTK